MDRISIAEQFQTKQVVQRAAPPGKPVRSPSWKGCGLGRCLFFEDGCLKMNVQVLWLVISDLLKGTDKKN